MLRSKKYRIEKHTSLQQPWAIVTRGVPRRMISEHKTRDEARKVLRQKHEEEEKK